MSVDDVGQRLETAMDDEDATAATPDGWMRETSVKDGSWWPEWST